jgi:hypothetical protein
MTDDMGGASVGALRAQLDQHPEVAGAHEIRLRLAAALMARGERLTARTLLEAVEAGGDAREQKEATIQLATADEEDGRLASAAHRWERLLADDIDHPEARAHLANLADLAASPLAQAGTASGTAQVSVPGATLISPAGVTVHRFEIVRELGRGATSTVYLARDRTLGIELALKVFYPRGPGTSRAAWARFFHEGRTAAALRHPGVVAIYDIDEEAHTLVMEYLPGGSVRDLLRRQTGTVEPAAARAPVAIDTALGWARSVLSALAFVHGRGIVHGDVTPRNLLLRGRAELVLADFGVAHLSATAADAESSDGPAGTPVYLAPEQFRGATSSEKTDLFAVGAVLWEALVGRPMRSHADLMSQRIAPVPLPADVAGAFPESRRPLAALVDALVATDPAGRPASAAAALALLKL